MAETSATGAVPSLIARERRGPLRALASRLLGLYYTAAGLDRYDSHRLERVAGMPILVVPSVANPRLLRTGALFAAQLTTSVLHSDTRVLDLGTGSGVCALAAARIARSVVGVDINPVAVRCARANAIVNRLDERIDLRVGDLFEPVAGERFDVVLFNPPFLIGAPTDARDAAWRSIDIPRRFAAGLRAHLSETGSALLLLSSFGDASAVFEAELRRHGFALTVHARHRYVNETVTILRVRVRP
ncbi:MAG: HemK2/MTQ2 family protein methyltransferase [Pseudomonadota bacterium]